MSTSAITPISNVDFGSTGATAPQQSVFNNLVGQLEQSIAGGDLTTTQTLLNAVEALSPSSASGKDALGAFLTGVGAALSDGSVGEAQSALTTYQSATTAATASAASTKASAASIASGLVLSQLQLDLVSSLLGVASANGSNSTSSDSSSSTSTNVLNILNAAYGNGDNSTGSVPGTTSGSAASTASTSSPYDTLVSALQANLTAGGGTASTALAYLGSTGNLVDTSA